MPTPILTWLDGTETTFVREWEATIPVSITGDAQPNECGGRDEDSWVSQSKGGYATGEWLGITFNVLGDGTYADDTTGNEAAVAFDAAITSLFWGINQSDSVVPVDTGYQSPRVRPLTASAAGSFVGSISVVLQRVAFAYFMDEDVRGADGSPTYGGAATDDINPRGTGRQWWWRIKPGSTLSWSLTGEGINLSGSLTVTQGMSDAFGPVPATYYAEAFASAGGTSTTVVSAWKKDVAGSDVYVGHPASHTLPPVPPYQFTERVYNFGSGASATAADSSTFCDVNEGGYIAPPARARMWATFPIQYRFVGVLRSDADPYPDTLAFTVQTGTKATSVVAAPTGAANIETRAALCLAENIVVADVSEHGKTRTWISSSALAAAGEDSRDWRCLWRGDQAPAMRLRQLAAIAVDGGSGANRSWPVETPGNWEAYARLRIALATTDAAAPVTVSCGSNPAKRYRVAGSPTAGAATIRTVQLCDPRSPSDAVDAHDTRYPLRNDGLPHEDGSCQGIARILSLAISAPGGISVTGIDLVADVRTASFLPAFLDWEQTQTEESVGSGVFPIVEVNRGVFGRADARRSFQEPTAQRTLSTDAFGNPLWIYSFPTITTLIGRLITFPGVQADGSPYTPDPDNPYLTVGEPGAAAYTGLALWLGGSGCTFDGEDPTFWLDLAIGDYATVPMQDLADEYVAIPEIGNPFGGGLNDPLLIRTCKFLRSPIDGAVYGLPGRDGPQASETVELRRASDDALRGSAVTDADGCYRTELPYAHGNVDHYGQVVGRDRRIDYTSIARRRQRMVFRIPLPASVRAILARRDGRLFRLRKGEGDEVQLGVSSGGDYAVWQDRGLGFEATDGDLERLPGDRIAVALVVDGQLLLAIDASEGQETLSMVTDGDATAGALATMGDGAIFAFRVDGGTVKCNLRSAADLSLIDGWDTNLTGLSEDARIAADDVKLPGNRSGLVLLVTDGETQSVYRSDDGREFA